MGSLFRSEEMIFCQMFLQGDCAYTAVSQLGELGIVQFKDLNVDVNAFQRHHVSEIRRCEEMERQLRFFEKELKKANVEPVELNAMPEAPPQRQMIDLEAIFESSEKELRDLNFNMESLEKNFVELTELECVLRQSDELFKQALMPESQDVGDAAEGDVHGAPSGGDIEEGPARDRSLQYITGVIPVSKSFGFQRLAFRVSRGTIFVKFSEIEEELIDPATGDRVRKCVFLAICYSDMLMQKLKKIAEGYRATLYPCPQSASERDTLLKDIRIRLVDLSTVLEKTREQHERCLHNLSMHILTWDIKVLKLKACFHTLNQLHREGPNYVAECWMPYSELSLVQTVLDRSSELCGSQVPSILHPVQAESLPTFHRVNKFTRAFQAIIDAYGVANYREVNPALFSIVTFPFLFSVMFGDAGHGLLLLLFALFLILNETKLKSTTEKSEIYSIIFNGRYMILFMGLFSVYSGMIYNDVFSKSLNIFGAKWRVVYDDRTLHSKKKKVPTATLR